MVYYLKQKMNTYKIVNTYGLGSASHLIKGDFIVTDKNFIKIYQGNEHVSELVAIIPTGCLIFKIEPENESR